MTPTDWLVWQDGFKWGMAAGSTLMLLVTLFGLFCLDSYSKIRKTHGN